MQISQLAPGLGKSAERLDIGDARQITFQVIGITRPVFGMVQQGVNVVENIPLADRLVAVMLLELFQRPIGDVFAAVAAVFIVDVEGEALWSELRSSKFNLVIHP